MKGPVVLTAALLWQSSLLVNIGADARPETMRYERSVLGLHDRGGATCAPLDASVLAHTASATHSDLRLFRTRLDGGGEREVPYMLTESGPEPVASTMAGLKDVAVRGNELAFNLEMPARAYSEVRLKTDLRDFVATVLVDGRDLQGHNASLGRMAVFDLSSQHLGHWTSLLFQESNWPILHVSLTVRTPDGTPETDLKPEMMMGAEVPPSRARQTRFVPVAETGHIEDRGGLSTALLRVPAHVPVERVHFIFQPALRENFSREVTVSARADGAPFTDTEALDAGRVTYTRWPSGDSGLYPIALREDALDATLGATLAQPATVLVAVENDGKPPLPIRAVKLEMRERQLCFLADSGTAYTLRYGDAALVEPNDTELGLRLAGEVSMAQLGPEIQNPKFVPRRDTRPLLSRHPELFWLIVLLCGGTMGAIGLQHIQQRSL